MTAPQNARGHTRRYDYEGIAQAIKAGEAPKDIRARFGIVSNGALQSLRMRLRDQGLIPKDLPPYAPPRKAKAKPVAAAGVARGSVTKNGLRALGLRTCCRACTALGLSDGVFYCAGQHELQPLTRHQGRPCAGFTPPRIEPHETEKRTARLARLAEIDTAREAGGWG